MSINLIIIFSATSQRAIRNYAINLNIHVHTCIVCTGVNTKPSHGREIGYYGNNCVCDEMWRL